MTTEEQRTQALKQANARRLTQAALRRKVRALPTDESRQAAAAILRANENGWIKLGYLLGSIHRFGPVRMERLLRKLAMSPGRLERPFGDLTERERNLLADYLEDPNRPGRFPVRFTAGDLAMVQEICSTLADRTAHRAKRDRLRSIARKCEAAA